MRRLLMLVPVAVGAVTLAGAALVPAAAGRVAGFSPLTIEKEVDGVVPPDTEFVVTVACRQGVTGGPIIFTPGGPVASVKVDFDAEGDPDGENTILFQDGGSCTVTETHDGDAEDVSYECEGTFGPASGGSPCVTSGPQEKPIDVLIESQEQDVTVTVTNEFPDPVTPTTVPAAQPLAVTPTFTG